MGIFDDIERANEEDEDLLRNSTRKFANASRKRDSKGMDAAFEKLHDEELRQDPDLEAAEEAARRRLNGS